MAIHVPAIFIQTENLSLLQQPALLSFILFFTIFN
mgnify:CR=1 FL=1